MASNYTTNYQLNQWEAGDQVLRTEFNQDNQKIDAALKTNADAIAANTEAVAEHATALAGKGNCQLYFLTRTGTGSKSVSVTFPHKPLLVMGVSDGYTIIMIRNGGCNCYSTNGNGSDFTASWSGNRVTWSGEFDYQICNSEGAQYPILALLAMDE